MKKRNLIKSCFLAVLLLLGVGYAAINNRTLTATGKLPIPEKDLAVKITGITGAKNVTVAPDGYSASFTLTTIYNDYLARTEQETIYVNVTNFDSLYSVSLTYDIEILDQDGNEIDVPNIFTYAGTEAWTLSELPTNQLMAIKFDSNFKSVELMKYEELTITISIVASPIVE